MFPIDRRRRSRSGRGGPSSRAGGRSPTLLVRTVSGRQIVAHRCERARTLGVRPGAALSAARAALPANVTPVILLDEPDRDRRALRAVATWALRYSPIVAPEEPDAILLDITGCDHLFGGEASMLRRVLGDLHRLGFRARGAIAPTFGAARAVARFGPEREAIVADGGVHDALAGLPVLALDMEGDDAAGLAEVGVKTVGELFALPRAAIGARYGVGALRCVDRALGRMAEAIEPVRAAEPVRIARVFDGPCACLETIGLACRETLERLGKELERREEGALEVVVTLERSDLEPARLALRLCAGSRDAGHLWSLLLPRLERTHLGFGVEGVLVEAARTARLSHGQGGWWGGSQARSREGDRLLDMFANRLGRDRVRRALIVESHTPERAFAWRSVLVPMDASRAEAPEGARPTILFDPPQPARAVALTPDGPVHRFEWRAGAGDVAHCTGPERLAGEWWRGGGETRDYFKVRDERGAWLWLRRDHAGGRWFVHGMWA